MIKRAFPSSTLSRWYNGEITVRDARNHGKITVRVSPERGKVRARVKQELGQD
mgnify:CR=1 FL=1